MEIGVLFQKLWEMGGPGAILAAVFAYLWWEERSDRKAALLRNGELQDKRVTDTREDVVKMATALAASTDAIENNTASIATLTRIVEVRAGSGGAR